MAKTYYLPILSVNLAHYFSSALVSPANYIKNRNEDIQNTFNDCLLLSLHQFTTETDCCLEIVFNEADEKATQITKHFFLFDRPLPISRVKGIYFQNESQKTTTVFNITSGAAFLPLSLVHVVQDPEMISATEIDKDVIQRKSTAKSWQEESIRFNRILGGIALFPIAKHQAENYPTDYFGILAYINVKIQQELEAQKVQLSTDYSWALQSNGQYTTLRDIIFSNVNDILVQQIAEKDNIKLEMRNGLYLLSSIPTKTNTYLSAILATYGQHKRKKIDDFIADFYSNKFDENRKEGIAFIFGINNGYTSFRKNYELNSFGVGVKFKLNSTLDYYTIESIYQFVFNQKKENRDFPYIDEWCPVYQEIPHSGRNSFTILDRVIYTEQNNDELLIERLSGNFLNLLDSLLPQFQPKDTNSIKNEINRTIRKEIESYQSNINKEFQYIIDSQDQKITSLEEQLSIIKSKSNKSAVYLTNSQVSEPETTYQQSTTGQKDLFTQNPSYPEEKKARKMELSGWGIGKLRDHARELSIKGYSKYKTKDKAGLIDRILTSEFSKT